MIKFEDYKDKEGKIDWTAYHQAQIDSGEKCFQCFGITRYSGGNSTRTRCQSCRELESSKEQVSHNKFLRCPSCGETWDPSECEDYHVYQDGDHSVTCMSCGKDFEIVTYVSYTFRSPERD